MRTLPALAGAALLAAALSTAPPAAAAPPTCDGLRATVVGTDGRDRLVGTSGPDVIAALGGNDTVSGRGGDDVVCGGDGADELDGGLGDDRLLGGRDLVEGGQTPYHRGDVLVGGPGDDQLDAGYDARGPEGGGDLISWGTATRGVVVHLARGTAVGQGRDTVALTAGRVVLSHHDDVLVGTAGAEEVHALGGDDRVYARGGPDIVWPDDVEEIGDDLVRAGAGRDVVTSLGGADTVVGGDGRDGLSGVAHRSTRVAGGAGDDLLHVYAVSGDGHEASGGAGADRLVLGTDDEVLSHVDLAIGADFPDGSVDLAGLEDFDLRGAPYDVRGTPGDDRVAVEHSVLFSGLAGDDVLGGSEEDDTFDGGEGTDTYLADLGGTNTCASVEEDPTGACSP